MAEVTEFEIMEMKRAGPGVLNPSKDRDLVTLAEIGLWARKNKSEILKIANDKPELLETLPEDY